MLISSKNTATETSRIMLAKYLGTVAQLTQKINHHNIADRFMLLFPKSSHVTPFLNKAPNVLAAAYFPASSHSTPLPFMSSQLNFLRSA